MTASTSSTSGIAWCQERYRDTPAPFRFVHADLRNSAYNPGGALDAGQLSLPLRGRGL